MQRQVNLFWIQLNQLEYQYLFFSHLSIAVQPFNALFNCHPITSFWPAIIPRKWAKEGCENRKSSTICRAHRWTVSQGTVINTNNLSGYCHTHQELEINKESTGKTGENLKSRRWKRKGGLTGQISHYTLHECATGNHSCTFQVLHEDSEVLCRNDSDLLRCQFVV